MYFFPSLSTTCPIVVVRSPNYVLYNGTFFSYILVSVTGPRRDLFGSPLIMRLIVMYVSVGGHFETSRSQPVTAPFRDFDEQVAFIFSRGGGVKFVESRF
jgi:hypothetical protein